MNELIASRTADVYLKESLVHYQYDWIIQLFEKNHDLKTRFEPIHFAALLLKNSSLEISLFVPELMLEAVLDVIKYVKERQEFYYGGK